MTATERELLRERSPGNHAAWHARIQLETQDAYETAEQLSARLAGCPCLADPGAAAACAAFLAGLEEERIVPADVLSFHGAALNALLFRMGGAGISALLTTVLPHADADMRPGLCELGWARRAMLEINGAPRAAQTPESVKLEAYLQRFVLSPRGREAVAYCLSAAPEPMTLLLLSLCAGRKPAPLDIAWVPGGDVLARAMRSAGGGATRYWKWLAVT